MEQLEKDVGAPRPDDSVVAALPHNDSVPVAWGPQCLHSASFMEEGRWRGRVGVAPPADGCLRFHPIPACGAVHVDMSSVRKLLAGKHVFVIGDGDSRHLALQLMYSVHSDDGYGVAPRRNRTEPLDAFYRRVAADLPRTVLRVDINGGDALLCESAFYYHAGADIRVSYLAAVGRLGGTHRPLGYRAGDDDGGKAVELEGADPGAFVAAAVADMGQVDELVLGFGGDPPVNFLGAGASAEERVTALRALEGLVKADRTPIFATMTTETLSYRNGTIAGRSRDGFDAATRLQWRILDRGGVTIALIDRTFSDVWTGRPSMADDPLKVPVDEHGLGVAVIGELAEQVVSMAVNADGGRAPRGDPPAEQKSPLHTLPEQTISESVPMPDSMLPLVPPTVYSERPPGRTFAPDVKWTTECLHASNLFQTGAWVGDVTVENGQPGVAHFQPPPECGSLDVDLDTVRRALSGRHILLAGDSVVRYQSRHLIYALHYGKWPPRFRGSKAKPSPWWEKDFDSWVSFFANLTADIGPDNFRCDCHRGEKDLGRWYENMYYYNKEFNFNVTYTVNNGMWRGSHLPMGYFPVAEKDPAVLFADRTKCVGWGGEHGPSAAEALKKNLGMVDEVVLALGGLWSAYYLAPWHPSSVRDDYIRVRAL